MRYNISEARCAVSTICRPLKKFTVACAQVRTMLDNQAFQGATFGYISLKDRGCMTHPLRQLRAIADALLATISHDFDEVYARRDRPWVSP